MPHHMSTVFNFVLIQDKWQLVYTAHNNHHTLLTNADVFHPWLGQKACEYRKDSYKNYIELTLVDGNWFQKYQFGKNQLCKPKNNWETRNHLHLQRDSKYLEQLLTQICNHLSRCACPPEKCEPIQV